MDVTWSEGRGGVAYDLMGHLMVGLRHWANNTGEALVLAVSDSAKAGQIFWCVCQCMGWCICVDVWTYRPVADAVASEFAL
jgi:hypothetical protein